MTRAATICLALLTTLGMATATEAAKAKKVSTEIEIEGIRFESGGVYTFVGDVHSPKTKCEKKRAVTLRYTGPDPAFDVDTTTTDHTGDFEISASFADLSGGEYVAEVERRKVGKGEKKRVCKAATSEPFTLD